MVAEEFPRTSFAVVAGYGGNNKNLGALVFRVSETGYLLGVVAALKSETNKVAYIGGEPYPSLIEESTAFEQGAKASNPSIEVSIEWVNSWVDVDKTRKLAQAQIDAGADVLMVSVNKASRAAFEAAEKSRVYAIASTWDQHEALPSELAPNTILSSNITRTPVLLLEGARLVQQGLWEGKQYKWGLREGALELAPFYGLLTPEEEETVKAVKEDILTGKIDLDQILAP
jgi:basic membrane protein A